MLGDERLNDARVNCLSLLLTQPQPPATRRSCWKAFGFHWPCTFAFPSQIFSRPASTSVAFVGGDSENALCTITNCCRSTIFFDITKITTSFIDNARTSHKSTSNEQVWHQKL